MPTPSEFDIGKKVPTSAESDQWRTGAVPDEVRIRIIPRDIRAWILPLASGIMYMYMYMWYL